MQEEKDIIEYQNENKKAYDTIDIVEEEQKRNYYEESIYALIQYMKNNDKNPSEKRWDKKAIDEKYLSSKTIGYLSGMGFNKLCRKLRKQINKNKRQIN